MILDYILLIALLLLVIWTVMTIRLIRAVVGLAMISVVVSILMFHLAAPLAGVFELSVCAGLISVIFITTISFTARVSKEQLPARRRQHLAKFWALPLIVIGLILLLRHYSFPAGLRIFQAAGESDPRVVLWNMRHMDLLGQIIVLLVGAFGVVALFKEKE